MRVSKFASHSESHSASGSPFSKSCTYESLIQAYNYYMYIRKRVLKLVYCTCNVASHTLLLGVSSLSHALFNTSLLHAQVWTQAGILHMQRCQQEVDTRTLGSR